MSNEDYVDKSYTPDRARQLLSDFKMRDLRAACRRLKVNPKGLTKEQMIERIVERDEGVYRG